MVRSLVGSMLDVSRGLFSVREFKGILENSEKDFGIFNAPAKGLCLLKVGYGSFPYLDEKECEIQKFPFRL
jgi:tRNA pseudouridine38-40 synthase